MATALWIPAASFFLCLLLTPLARSLARRCNLVDGPDGRRKMQQSPVPVAGGLAILVSAATVLAVAVLFHSSNDPSRGIEPGRLLGLFVASVVICAVGLADDFGYLRGRHKIIGQFIAAAVVTLTGVEVRHIYIFELDVELGLLSIPFTIFFLLGAINSLNLIDGMDGLLGTVALIVTGAFAVLAVLGNHYTAACVALALAGAILAFLRYNLPPASIYLGDCGSMLIGLIVGVLAIQSSLKGPAAVALAAPIAVMIIPILDTTAAILRRKLTGRSLYDTDRGHIHHCLLHKGFSRWTVLSIVSGLSLITVIGALASLAYRNELLAVISVAVVVAVLIVSRLFGHVELRLVQRRLLGVVLSMFHGPTTTSRVKEEEMHLQGSISWGDYWVQLTESAITMGLTGIRLDLNAPSIQEGYHARWGHFDHQEEKEWLWRAEIPLTVHTQVIGRVEFSGLKAEGNMVEKISAVSTLVGTIERDVALLVDPFIPAPLKNVRLKGNESSLPITTKPTVHVRGTHPPAKAGSDENLVACEPVG